MATLEGSTIDVTDVQDYTNARSLIIDGKLAQGEPARNLISQTDFG